MKSQKLFVVPFFFLALTLLLAGAINAEPTDERQVIFTGCPPYVEGNHCDSIYYQVVAVDIKTRKSCPAIRYHLVEGPGYINEKSGLWVYHPDLPADETIAGYMIEIAASLNGDTTQGEDNCRFDCRVMGDRPHFQPAPGIHINATPGVLARASMSVEDNDECDTWEWTAVRINPQPAGMINLNPESGTLAFIPSPADSGISFRVEVEATDGEVFAADLIYFDVFEPEPITLRLESKVFGQPGDTVEVDLVIEDCPVNLSRVNFRLIADDRYLRFVGGMPGDGFGSDGCDQTSFSARSGRSCAPDMSNEIVYLSAAAGSGDGAGCLWPQNVPSVLATLRYVIVEYPQDGGRFVPINFMWCDCRDNVLLNSDRTTAYYPRHAYTHTGRLLPAAPPPSISATTDDCYLDSGAAPERIRCVDLHAGGVSMGEPDTTRPTVVRIEANYGPEYHGLVQGQPVTIDVRYEDDDQLIGGFDLLIEYNFVALAVAEVTEGDFLTDCGWEYFSYRAYRDTTCGSQCTKGLLRIVGLADMNNGDVHPSCYQPESDTSTLAHITFLLTDDRTFEGQWLPIDFVWHDCGDNAIASPDGDQVYVSNGVFNTWDTIIALDDTLPAYGGAPDFCLEGPSIPGLLSRAVTFRNGGILVGENIDSTAWAGDINLNGLAYEFADLILFSRYFEFGPSVFPQEERSIANSDVNRDGIPLMVADFVYMRRIISGDAVPYDPPPPAEQPTSIFLSDQTVWVAGVNPLGGIYMEFEGEVSVTQWPMSTDGSVGYLDGNTRVFLTTSDGGSVIVSGNLLQLDSETTLLHADAATPTGQVVVVELDSPTDVEGPDNLPDDFGLRQNYPNPFNPSTTVEFDLPVAADVRIDIFNVAGQRVVTLLDESREAGRHRVDWDGRDETGNRVSSGMYLYRMTAGEFVSTKKMMLLK